MILHWWHCYRALKKRILTRRYAKMSKEKVILALIQAGRDILVAYFSKKR